MPHFIHKKLTKNFNVDRKCLICLSTGNLFEVNNNERQYIVDLGVRSCNYCLWQINGLPCKHAMACIMHNRAMPKDYINGFFFKDAFSRCYSGNIFPILDQSLWPRVNCDELDPPPFKRKAYRPKILKRRESSERPLEKKRDIT